MKKINDITTTQRHELPAPTEITHSDKNIEINRAFLDDMVEHNEKVLCFRMDIHLPEECVYDEPDGILLDFMNDYTNSLSRQGLENSCVVTIKDGVNNSHMHSVVLVDGKAKNSTRLIQQAESAWSDTLALVRCPNGGLIDFCNKDKDGKPQQNEVMIDRNSKLFNTQYDQAHQQISCLAKEKDDDATPNRVRKIFYSRHKSSKGRDEA